MIQNTYSNSALEKVAFAKGFANDSACSALEKFGYRLTLHSAIVIAATIEALFSAIWIGLELPNAFLNPKRFHKPLNYFQSCLKTSWIAFREVFIFPPKPVKQKIITKKPFPQLQSFSKQILDKIQKHPKIGITCLLITAIALSTFFRAGENSKIENPLTQEQHPPISSENNEPFPTNEEGTNQEGFISSIEEISNQFIATSLSIISNTSKIVVAAYKSEAIRFSRHIFRAYAIYSICKFYFIPDFFRYQISFYFKM